jgi:hypothetical protein
MHTPKHVHIARNIGPLPRKLHERQTVARWMPVRAIDAESAILRFTASGASTKYHPKESAMNATNLRSSRGVSTIMSSQAKRSLLSLALVSPLLLATAACSAPDDEDVNEQEASDVHDEAVTSSQKSYALDNNQVQCVAGFFGPRLDGTYWTSLGTFGCNGAKITSANFHLKQIVNGTSSPDSVKQLSKSFTNSNGPFAVSITSACTKLLTTARVEAWFDYSITLKSTATSKSYIVTGTLYNKQDGNHCHS